MDRIKVSIAKNVFGFNNLELVDLGTVITRIRSDQVLKRQISAIRQESGKKERQKLKQRLPSMNMGRYKDNKLLNDNLLYIQYILFDFDEFDSDPEITNFRDKLSEDENVLCHFISPSGNGVKVICKMPNKVETDEEYKRYWHVYTKHFRDKYGQENDPSTKDARRICFLSYDEGIYYNRQALPLFTPSQEQFDAALKENDPQATHNSSQAASPFPPLPPKNNSKDLSSSREQLEEDVASACKHLAGKVNDYNSWLKVGMALAGEFGEKGRSYFLEVSQNPNYQDKPGEINRKYSSFLRAGQKKTNIETVFFLARNAGWTPEKRTTAAPKKRGSAREKKQTKKSLKFWRVNPGSSPSKGKLDIPRTLFIKFLSQNGIAKYWLDEARYIYIRIQDNIVEEMNSVKIKDFVVKHIKSLDHQVDSYIYSGKQGAVELNFSREELLETIMHKKIFTDDCLEYLESVEVEFLRDGKDYSMSFYNNCWVMVTRKSIEVKEYRELNSYIWKKQIINRDFSRKTQREKSEFGIFLSHVTLDEKRYLAMLSAIGYLLHSYKDKTAAKCVILMDEKLGEDDEANGRTGKSLIGSALQHLRPVKRLDGRNFDFTDRFKFQEIDEQHMIIDFNDANKKFDFDRLFSIITDDMTVEKKGIAANTIPFQLSPKLLLSTNYVIKNMDQSSRNRQFVVELADYYNDRFTPVEDFGHRLFDDWTPEEWLNFDNFMQETVRYYLRNGLQLYKVVNAEEKNLIAATDSEFVKICDSMTPELIADGKYFYPKTQFLENIRDESTYEKIGTKKLGKWFLRWCKSRGYHMEEERKMTETGAGFKQVRGFTLTYTAQDDEKDDDNKTKGPW